MNFNQDELVELALAVWYSYSEQGVKETKYDDVMDTLINRYEDGKRDVTPLYWKEQDRKSENLIEKILEKIEGV